MVLVTIWAKIHVHIHVICKAARGILMRQKQLAELDGLFGVLGLICVGASQSPSRVQVLSGIFIVFG